jgi:hypothetical protein
VDAGRCALARGVEARELAAPVEVGHDAADRVVRGRSDRNRCLGRVVSLLQQAAHQRREAAAVDRPEVEQNGSARCDLPRDDVARSELVGEPVALLVQQQRALASERFGQQQRRVDEGRRMELHELEIRERRTGSIRRRHPLTDRPRWIRRSLPEGGGAARREQCGPRRNCSVVRDDADAAFVVAPDREHALASATWIAGCASTRSASLRATRSPVAAPPACTTRRGCAALRDRVHPSNSTPSSTRSRSGAGASSVRPSTRSGGTGHGRSEGVLGVERRIVVLAHRGRDAALREQARRREQRPLS